MKKELFVLGLCICMICNILFAPNVYAKENSATISITMYRIAREDEIEGWLEGEADWSYKIWVYDGNDWQEISNEVIESDDIIIDVTHTLTVYTTSVNIYIALIERDVFGEELADISSTPGDGLKSFSGTYPGGARYRGVWNLETNSLSGDVTVEDGGYYKTSGSFDGSTNITNLENDASLWFDISDKYITVNSPQSGETWYQEETQIITWDTESAGSNVKIELYKSGVNHFTISSSTSNDGSYSWAIPNGLTISSSFKIRITSTSYISVYGESDYFSIQEPIRYITVTFPSSGSTWYVGKIETIAWNWLNAGSNVKIELYKSGSLASTIISSTSNDGSYSWTIPSSLSISSSYKIKISSTSYSNVEDESDYFSIDEERYITVNSPYSGNTWYQGETETITWNSLNAGSYVKIELYKSSSLVSTVSSSTSNDGSYSWTIPTSLTSSSSYKIKITSTQDSNVNGYSSYFSIENVPSIYVKSANSGETSYNGEKYIITWSSVNSGDNVKIELYKNSKYYSTIVSSTSNDGRYTWKIPSSLSSSSSYKIKITSTLDSSVYDDSNSYLTIKETWLQKWQWAIAITVLIIVVLIGTGIGAHVKSKKKKRVFEKEKKEIKDIIHKATSEKKKKQRKTEGKKKGKQKTKKKEKRSKKKDDKK